MSDISEEDSYKCLDDLLDLKGKVEPHIYAFSTAKVPNALKIGDTTIGVNARINQWSSVYKDATKRGEWSAIVNNGDNAAYFRDFEIHDYLNGRRLDVNSDTDFPYFVSHRSKEFFRSKSPTYDDLIKEINKAVEEINNDYKNGGIAHRYYKLDDLKKSDVEEIVRDGGTLKLRTNQQEAVDNFKNAVNSGRNNLLMYAVMRFGKTFTALMCAKAMDYKLILVVSGKADVKDEWKKTVLKYDNFENWDFFDSDALQRQENNFKCSLNDKNKTVVVFLTLQDLYTKNDSIKEKHKLVLDSNIDMVIVDETHFAARSEHYGNILNNSNFVKDITYKQIDASSSDSIESAAFNEKFEKLKIKRNVTLHLSGTPYRILAFGGSEFEDQDIICKCRYTDIIKEQEKWNDNPFCEDDNSNIAEHEEWENPYFGFPQMIRFAFNPSQRVLNKLNEFKQNGYSYSFSELFRTKSLDKNDLNDPNAYKRFIYDGEILELFKTIDGSQKDENVFSFLDHSKIEEKSMCRHIVIVLPFKASCDALAALFERHKNEFNNLKDYHVINIAGFDARITEISKIKKAISDFAEKNEKTITLTVNKMLTGSTVPEWDTMIYLKDTASPQEYDQAAYRLQSAYIKTYKNDEAKEIKVVEKPLTLFVDFSPRRMYMIEEQKSSLFISQNPDETGENQSGYIDEDELSLQPIMTFDEHQLIEVKPVDILNAISDYNSDRSIIDETYDIRVDLAMLRNSDIKKTIDRENEINSKKGLSGETYERDIRGDDDYKNKPSKKKGEAPTSAQKTQNEEDNNPALSDAKKIRSYYAKLLLFSFLTENKNVHTIKDVLDAINTNGAEDDKRIARHLGLYYDSLKEIICYLSKNSASIIQQLNYKINNLNRLDSDPTIDKTEKVDRALKQIGNIDSNAVYTPSKITDDMTNLIEDKLNEVTAGKAILDIASTAGEYAVALYKKMKELNLNEEAIKESIYTIPKNNICYELVYKVYKLLGLDINHISNFTALDLMNLVTKKYVKRDGQRKNVNNYDNVKNLFDYISNNPESFNNVNINCFLPNKKSKKKANSQPQSQTN